MQKCKFEKLIDDYLLNRLDEEKRNKFEEHYFSCPHCFEKMVERDEIISIVKYKGKMIFQEEYGAEEGVRATRSEKIISLLTPKQWATAALTATLLFIIASVFIFVFMPSQKPTVTPSSFFLSEEITRARDIRLISPVGDIKTVPSKLEWKIKIFLWQEKDEDVEYKISIYDNDTELWTTNTEEQFIELPEEVREAMKLGKEYSWRVMCFSPQGTVAAISGTSQFKISNNK